ncbi:MAG: hypothetical protein Q9M30_05495 [Mariprofundaceae bacterium]|nr:hypothetical protein [Mariprofundaceae bacterium]
MHPSQDIHKSLLRPAFTHALATSLQLGASINLIAPHGLGRRRTVQDLRRILPSGMRVLYADIRFNTGDLPALLKDLCTQAGLQGMHITNLALLVEALASRTSPTLLILHNIDLLRPGSTHARDPLFDTALLSQLCRFADHPHLALLTVSEAVYPDWPLPCEPLPIPQ